jgi:hypothetical protein
MRRLRRMAAVATVMVTLSIPGTLAALTLKCDVDTKNYCAEGGCKSLPPNDEYILVNTDNETYSLCVNGRPKCQVLKLRGGQVSGAFFIFKLGGASFMKMSTSDVELVNLKRGQFLEVRDNIATPPNCPTMRGHLNHLHQRSDDDVWLSSFLM